MTIIILQQKTVRENQPVKALRVKKLTVIHIQLFNNVVGCG